MLKISFGCGPKLLPGWVGCDIRPLPGVKFVCNAWEIEQHVALNSVDEAMSRHFLEHVTYEQARHCVLAWRRVLKSNASLTIIVPNLEYALRQLMPEVRKKPSDWNPNFTNEQHGMATLYGWQKSDDWDVHRWAYTENSLRVLVEQFGLVFASQNVSRPWELNMTWRKGYGADS